MKKESPQYVHEMLTQSLKEMGCIGLKSTDFECSCLLEDLCPCDFDFTYCAPLQEKE